MAAFSKDRYLSRAFEARELEGLWPRVWHLAGAVADLPQPGAWLTFQIGRQSLLVVRGPDRVRAFHNVCLHRGRALCDPGLGRGASLVCPYHRWQYGLDGRLLGVPSEDRFTGCLDRERATLAEIAVETFAGFFWVCLAESPEPLEQYLGPLAERLAGHALEQFALVEDLTAEVACNWKVGVDAFNEAYHLSSVHPELCRELDPTRVSREALGRHNLIRVPSRTTPGLSSDQYFIFPNTTLSVFGTRLMLMRHRPHADSPERMLLDQQQFERAAPGAPRPPRPAWRLSPSLGHVTDQDLAQLPQVQRGMRSPRFDGPILGRDEELVAHMHRTLDAYLDGV
jgi:phenylpropionate dioxygenase-like ring-hydroxylating dioxygenase large terminal subunit